MTDPPAVALPTLVLVDDSDELRMVIRLHVERANLFTVVAEGANGDEAIALAETHRPDVMLLDVSMPGTDGFEALPRVRAVSPGTEVVMLTGFAQHGLAQRARQLGALALLEKTVSLKALPGELARLLGERQPSPDFPTPPVRPAEESAPVVVEQQERFREVFEEAAIGLGTMTLAGHLVRANKNFAALANRPALEMVGLGYVDLLPADLRPTFLETMRAATAPLGDPAADPEAEPVFQLEHELAGAQKPRLVRTTLAPVRDSQGSALYLFVQLQDVTEQRRAETALRRTEQRFRLVLDAVDDAITMLDPEGRMQSWNPGAERMQGYTADEAIGQHVRILFPEDQRRIGHPEHVLRLALRDRHYEEEGWRVRKDGSRFWADVVITSVTDPDGTHVGFATISRDVTARRQAWIERETSGAELDRANAELQAANAGLTESVEEQAQFVAMTAHELRTPVAVIADLAQLLHEDGEDPVERAVMTRTMMSSSGRLQRLLDDLLTAARLDAHAMTLDRRLISLGATLRQSVDAAVRRYPDISITLDAGGADDLVLADQERLGQIVDNLLNNAVNHGQPPVRLGVVTGGDAVELHVVDSGAGVPELVRDRLFDRYVTAARSGTGLGLYIVRQLARAHGGNAWYRADGPQPEFIVSLPRAGALAPADRVQPGVGS